MVNGLMPWGNCHLLPLGPLREPLTALRRADVVIVHHADLVCKTDLSQFFHLFPQHYLVCFYAFSVELVKRHMFFDHMIPLSQSSSFIHLPYMLADWNILNTED